MKTTLHTSRTYSANRTLESIVWLTALTIIVVMLSISRATANPVDFEDEAYIDDIPFNTEMVASSMIESAPVFEEEAYIDDIPFNTAAIAKQYRFEAVLSVNFELDEENYIDDIPFETELICNNRNICASDSLEANKL